MGEYLPHKVASVFSVSFVAISGLLSAYEHTMWYHLHEVLHHPWEPVHYGISTWCLANISLCARMEPRSSDSRAPEKSWKGHLATEVKRMSFRESQAFLYHLLRLSSSKDRCCPYRWGQQYCDGLLDKETCMGLCGPLKHSSSPKMPVSLSWWGWQYCDDQMVKIIERWGFLFCVQVTWPQHWVPQVSCS